MCQNLSSLLAFCQNVSTLPQSFHFQTVVFQDSPFLNLSDFSQNISSAYFLNQVPSQYFLSRLQYEFQINTFPDCTYKLSEIPLHFPHFQNEKSIIFLFFFLFLMLVYLFSCLHMLIKVSINSEDFSCQLMSTPTIYTQLNYNKT